MTTLAIVASDPMRYFVVNTAETADEITLDGRLFKEFGLGRWVGFYDWLRPGAWAILGVRTWMADPHLAPIKEALSKHPSIEMLGDELRVFFGSERQYVEHLSGDQELGTNRVLIAEDGTYLLLFDVLALNPAELSSLKTYADEPR